MDLLQIIVLLHPLIRLLYETGCSEAAVRLKKQNQQVQTLDWILWWIITVIKRVGEERTLQLFDEMFGSRR